MKTEIQYCWECGGKAEVKFAEGRERKVCTDCGLILYENPFPTTAAIVVNSDDEILLVRRAVPPSQGEWCLPGGFLELNETPEEGVIRELREETQVTGSVADLIGVSPSLHGFWGDVVVIGFHVTPHDNQLIPGDDAMEVRYFPLENHPQLAFSTHRDLIDLFLKSRD